MNCTLNVNVNPVSCHNQPCWNLVPVNSGLLSWYHLKSITYNTVNTVCYTGPQDRYTAPRLKRLH